MANESISGMVLLIVSLTVAAILGGVVLQYAQEISGSIKRRGNDLSMQIETDITIINDPQHVIENIDGKDAVVLYVKNTGSSTLDDTPKLVDVFIDGEFLGEDNISMEVIDENYWGPHAVLKIETTYTREYLGFGDHSAKVITFNTEDELKFRLEGG